MRQRSYFRCIAEWLDIRQLRRAGTEPGLAADPVIAEVAELDWMAEAWRVIKEMGRERQ